jgi:hypothetical protein
MKPRRTPAHRFQVTFEGRLLTFWMGYSPAMRRECVNGPAEKIDDCAFLLLWRAAAVEVARTPGRRNWR